MDTSLASFYSFHALVCLSRKTMLDESKINEISGCDAVIKTSIDLPTVLSIIEVQSLLLQKLRVEMSKLSERNAAIRAENSMLRRKTRRQQMSQQNSDEEKLYLCVTGEKLTDKNSVRFSQDNHPKLAIDNLKEDPKPSSMQPKNFFVSKLDDLITIPLEKELLMKKTRNSTLEGEVCRKRGSCKRTRSCLASERQKYHECCQRIKYVGYKKNQDKRVAG